MKFNKRNTFNIYWKKSQASRRHRPKKQKRKWKRIPLKQFTCCYDCTHIGVRSTRGARSRQQLTIAGRRNVRGEQVDDAHSLLIAGLEQSVLNILHWNVNLFSVSGCKSTHLMHWFAAINFVKMWNM